MREKRIEEEQTLPQSKVERVIGKLTENLKGLIDGR